MTGAVSIVPRAGSPARASKPAHHRLEQSPGSPARTTDLSPLLQQPLGAGARRAAPISSSSGAAGGPAGSAVVLAGASGGGGPLEAAHGSQLGGPGAAGPRMTIGAESALMARLRALGLRGFVGICLLLALAGIVYLGYFCPDHVCALSARELPIKDLPRIAADPLLAGRTSGLGYDAVELEKNLLPVHPAYRIQSMQGALGYDDVFLNESFKFDINAHDVIVFLHIQKTGGTLFGKHLVRDLYLQRPCSCQRRRKRCFCFRPKRNENWLFSRYSTGWKCGLHADWTELTSCVDSELNKMEDNNVKRRYFYITIIRDPVARYLSEFRHVQRGATWRGARHWCGGSESSIPQCYSGSNWKGVTLEEFMSCPYNLASNRQTRMLADLSLTGCYNSTLKREERDRIMLASAKHNLKYMPFFMLTEYQKVGQYSFEEIFGMRFAVAFEQHNATLSAATMATLTPKQLDAVRKLNRLDLELYEFAKNLAFQRLRRLRDRDPYYFQRIQNLGKLPSRQNITEFNWDSVIEDTTDVE